MQDLIQQATDLILEYGYLIVFALAAADNLGLPSAGDVALLAGAAAAADDRGNLEWHLVVGAAFLGGLMADHLSYAIGRFGGGPIVRRFVPKRFLLPIETRLNNNAGKTVASARMIAGFRAGVPVVSGVSRMPYRTFAVYNFFGVVVWAVTVGLLGLIFARSVATVAAYFETGTQVAAIVAIALIAVVVVVTVRRMKQRTQTEYEDLRESGATASTGSDGLDLEELTVRRAARAATSELQERRRERRRERGKKRVNGHPDENGLD